MRLIDADELKNAIIHHLGIRSEKNLLMPERSIYSLIDKQPTVELRKNGKWIITGRKNVYGGIEIKCPCCDDTVMVQYVKDELFCRHCGADMRKEGDEG